MISPSRSCQGLLLPIRRRADSLSLDEQYPHPLGAIEAGEVRHCFHRQLGLREQPLGSIQPAGVDFL